MSARVRATAPTGGFTLVEVLVALLLGCLLGVLALGTLARQRTLQADLVRRGEVLAAVRTARHLLGREVRGGDGSHVSGPDSLVLRAYRGVGLVCAGAGGPEHELFVRVTGVRVPEPAKDSVLVLGADGAERVLALVGREPGAVCPGVPDLPFERWRLSGAVGRGPVLARWFEPGSYHLSGRALRYRRGAGGRQPLTPEVLGAPAGVFVPREDGLRMELYTAGGRAHLLSLGRSPAPPR